MATFALNLPLNDFLFVLISFFPIWIRYYILICCPISGVHYTRAMRSRLEPMKKFVRTLRRHQPLLMNWFKAKKAYSSGAVEGLNRKVNLVTRRSYGFRNYDVLKIALFHTMGKLPEPGRTHSFFGWGIIKHRYCFCHLYLLYDVEYFKKLIAALTGGECRASKRSLLVKFAVSGPVPGSGAKRRDQGLDAVSTAFSAAQPPRTLT